MNENSQKVVDCLKKHKKLILLCAIILFAITIFFTVLFSVESEAQKGYNLAKEDLEISLYAPETLEITKVYCFETIIEDKKVSNPVDYVYKICYSAENKAGLKVNGVVYYGYLEYSKSVVCYGEDSSVFNTESTFNESIKIRQ